VDDELDGDGYPSEEALDRVTKWDIGSRANITALMEFVGSLWQYAEYGYFQREPERPDVAPEHGRVERQRELDRGDEGQLHLLVAMLGVEPARRSPRV
jgi:hypothetical protein